MRIEDLSESKSTKAEANYQSKPHAGQRCINCTMWRDPNKCSAVAGNISPDGWCDWYAGGAYGKRGKKIDEDGRIVKGVNTTVDVGPEEIKKQSAKFGNKVDKDGFPPHLRTDGRGSGSTINETEILDEGWRENLYRLVTIGALSLSVATGITSKLAYDKWAAANPEKVQALDTEKVKPLDHPRSSVSNPGVDKMSPSDIAPTTSLRPKPRPAEIKPIDQIKPKPKPSLDTLGPLSKTLRVAAADAGITGTELIALMAQAAHETGMFNDLYENGTEEYFDKYEPGTATGDSLGNTEAGDGYLFRGRGYLHLTGRYNYQKAQDALGYDFINNPDLAADPTIAAEVAIWYWKNRVQPRVKDFDNVKKVTYYINPKFVGLADRRSKYKEIYKLVKNFNIDIDENFKDGKNPGRKGLSKRMGVNTKASVSSLRKTAKNSSGEKQRMAHWLANMKAGRKKASESDEQPRYTASEWAIIEGGHVLEDQAPEKLFSWLINTDKDI